VWVEWVEKGDLAVVVVIARIEGGSWIGTRVNRESMEAGR